MKGTLGVSMAELLVAGCSGTPKPASFTAAHQYTEGSINYSAEYNSDRACMGDRSYRNISISVEDSTPIVAEFVVPGRANGPIIQRIGPNTPKKVNVTIEGVSPPGCCPNIGDICINGVSLPADVANAEISGLKLIQNQETINSIDGSYNISRSYIDIS
jgi:hypothetical protein